MIAWLIITVYRLLYYAIVVLYIDCRQWLVVASFQCGQAGGYQSSEER